MRKSKYLSLTALGALGVAAGLCAPALAVNLVADGSFESDALGQLGTASSPWFMGSGPFSPGYTWIFSNNAAGGQPAPSNGTFSLYPPAATTEGTQFLGSDGTFLPESVNQIISGLIPGHTYALTFDWAGSQQLTFSGVTTQMWQVSLGGGTPQDTPTVTVPSMGFVPWMQETMDFTATSATETLSFLAVGTCVTFPTGCGPTIPGGPPFVLLDSVALNSIPEPSTWAMLIIGFAGLGYAGFRSSRRKAISIG
jgi:hypothetical protein